MAGNKARPEQNQAARHPLNRKRLLIALFVFAAAGAGIWLFKGGASAEVNYRDAVLIAKGSILFEKNCAVCHGNEGVGENPQFVKGGQKPGGSYWAPAVNGKAHTWHHPPDALFRIIKEGSPASDSPMRGWEGRLNDTEIHALLAYIQSLWPEPLRNRYEEAFQGQ